MCFIFSCLKITAQKENIYFPDQDLTYCWVYYYPEHWDESQWDRDLKQIAELGFEAVHIGEFAWAQIEPQEGVYQFDWLDKAIDLADKHHLKVILCTSTATPPIWLSRKYPEILIKNENGTTLDHGARQHASFASPKYRELSIQTIEVLAQRYGKDKRIIGWQLDNEPAVQYDYNEAAQEAFRVFLQEKYQDIHQLNEAWGTSFWSQVYGDFSQINIPQMSVKFMNHHQILDYRRFAAKQTADFLDLQSKTLKRYISPQQFVTSNYIPNYGDGHITLSKELDFHSYTRYMVYGDNKGIGPKGYRVGEPLRIAFANDFFRPIDGFYGTMELQPGQVNWGEINSQPLPGAIRLWLWSVFSGGSDFICTYRYRQPLVGTEQYHYGIVGTDGVSVTVGGREYEQFMKEVKKLRSIYGKTAKNTYTSPPAAILYNHENTWTIKRQEQNKIWDTEAHLMKYYTPLKSFGIQVDVIHEKDDFSKYPVLVVPAYQMIDDSLVARWNNYAQNGGNLIFSCRTGHKDRYGRLFEAKFGEKMFSLIGAEMKFYDLLQPNHPDQIQMDGKNYKWNTWGEIFKPYKGTEVWGVYQGDFYAGEAAVLHRKLGKGSVTYVGADSRSGDLEKAVLQKLYTQLNIPVMNLPEGIVVEYRDNFGIAMNYSNKDFEFPLPENAQIIIGDRTLHTTDVLVWTLKK